MYPSDPIPSTLAIRLLVALLLLVLTLALVWSMPV